MRFQYMPYLTTGITARRSMVLDHLADQSEILINGPGLVQGVWTGPVVLMVQIFILGV